MRRTLILLACTLPLLAASQSSHPFAFKVQVTLSPKAAARLRSLNEGIIVSATYSGDPIPAAEKQADEIGRIDLGAEKIEMPGKSGTADISGGHVNRAFVMLIQGPILLNVNVYSARHSGPDNILNCDFFDGKLQDAAPKTIPIHCSLISEKKPTVYRH